MATKEGEKVGATGEAELPVTPTMEVPDAMTGSPIDLEEMGEPSERQREEEREHRPYAPNWTIYPETTLRQPLDRAEWVSWALPPAEMAVFAGAQMYDICDMANRAAVMATVSANSMQQLLCDQDVQMKKWKTEVTALRTSKSQVDRLLGEALRKEQNMTRELETLRDQPGRVPELENRLAQGEAEVMGLKAQGAELEKAKRRLAEVEDVKSQLAQKEKEVEELYAENLSLTEKLFWSEETRKYLMTTGIGEIVAKCRASHEFGKLVGRLTSDMQAMGKTDLVRELQRRYFPNEKLEDIPGFSVEAENRAEAAFRSLRYDPVPFQILADLSARPDMNSDEIRKLKNSALLSSHE